MADKSDISTRGNNNRIIGNFEKKDNLVKAPTD